MPSEGIRIHILPNGDARPRQPPTHRPPIDLHPNPHKGGRWNNSADFIARARYTHSRSTSGPPRSRTPQEVRRGSHPATILIYSLLLRCVWTGSSIDAASSFVLSRSC